MHPASSSLSQTKLDLEFWSGEGSKLWHISLASIKEPPLTMRTWRLEIVQAFIIFSGRTSYIIALLNMNLPLLLGKDMKEKLYNQYLSQYFWAKYLPQTNMVISKIIKTIYRNVTTHQLHNLKSILWMIVQFLILSPLQCSLSWP